MDTLNTTPSIGFFHYLLKEIIQYIKHKLQDCGAKKPCLRSAKNSSRDQAAWTRFSFALHKII